jgi:integrase
MAIKSYVEDNQNYYEVYVHGHDANGSRQQWRRRGITSLRKAETIEFELKRKLAMLKERAIDLRFGEWVEESLGILKLSFRPSTTYTYEKIIQKWMMTAWKDLYLREISKQKIYAVLYEGKAQEMSDAMRRYVLKIIKRIFQMAVDHDKLDRNPATGMSVKVAEKEKKVLTGNEVKTFLKEAQITNHRFYPIWVMALFTGMRSGELYALKWSDVDLENRIIHVSKSWSSKNGFTSTKSQKSRVVPISSELMSFLKERRLKGETKEFVLPHLPEWSQGAQAEVIRSFCKSIGVTQVKFHDLRATFITNLLTRGESLARVMAIVGHADIDTTNVYLRLAGVEIMGATDKLSYEIPTQHPAQILRLPNFGSVE